MRNEYTAADATTHPLCESASSSNSSSSSSSSRGRHHFVHVILCTYLQHHDVIDLPKLAHVVPEVCGLEGIRNPKDLQGRV